MRKQRINSVLILLSLFMLVLSSCSLATATDEKNTLSNSSRSASPEEWAVGVYYGVGDKVSYSNGEFECRQPHTSVAPLWTPTNAPALWEVSVSATDNGAVKLWTPGIELESGDIVLYEEDYKYYRAIVKHKTNITWLPPDTITVYEEVEEKPLPEITFDTDKEEVLRAYYKEWKEKYLFTAKAEKWGGGPTPGPFTVDGGMFVYYNGPSKWDGGGRTFASTESEHASPGESDPNRRITTSEAHGYGMMAAAILGDRYTFSKLNTFYNYWKNKQDGSMPWAISVTDSFNRASDTDRFPTNDPCNFRPYDGLNLTYDCKVASFGTATDAEMDIAYALIIAYKRWNLDVYRKAATTILHTILEGSIHGTYNHIKLGDWALDGETELTKKADTVNYPNYEINKDIWEGFDYSLVTRTSDFLLENLKVFKEFDLINASKWQAVYDATIDAITEASNSDTGLLGDFVYYDEVSKKYKALPNPVEAKGLSFHSSPVPKSGIYHDIEDGYMTIDDNGTTKKVKVPGNYTFLESIWDGDLYYNASRTPWRISSGVLLGNTTTELDGAIKTWSDFGNENYFSRKYKDINGNTNDKPGWLTGLLSGYALDGRMLPDGLYDSPTFTAPYLVLSKAAGDTVLFDEIWSVMVENRAGKNKIGGKFTSDNYADYFSDAVRLMSVITASYKK